MTTVLMTQAHWCDLVGRLKKSPPPAPLPPPLSAFGCAMHAVAQRLFAALAENF